MELGIGFGNPLHDLRSFLDRWLHNSHRLETALQSSIFLNVLSVLIKSSCTNDLDLATRQGRLQNVRRIHGTFRIARTNQIVDLVNNQNNVSALLDLTDQTLHAAFKLASKLGTCYQSSQIQKEDFLITQLVGNIAGCDPLSKTFCNSGFTDAGFTNQTGIVLLPAIQDLDNTLRLHIPTNDLIQLAFPRSAGQVHAVAVQELMLL